MDEARAIRGLRSVGKARRDRAVPESDSAEDAAPQGVDGVHDLDHSYSKAPHETPVVTLARPGVEEVRKGPQGRPPLTLLPGVVAQCEAAYPHGGRLPPDTAGHDALRALYTIAIYEKVDSTDARRRAGFHYLEEVPRPLRAPRRRPGGSEVVGRRRRGATTGRPPNARHRVIVARVGNKCHLEVEVHGADYRKIERGPATVTKEAGRRAAIIEAGSRRTDEQGRRKSTAARMVPMAGPDSSIECLGTKALPISDV